MVANEKHGMGASERVADNADATVLMPMDEQDATEASVDGSDATVGMEPEEFVLDTAPEGSDATVRFSMDDEAGSDATVLLSAGGEAFPDTTVDDLDATDSAMWKVTSEPQDAVLGLSDLGWDDVPRGPDAANLSAGDTVASPMAQAALQEAAQRIDTGDTANTSYVAGNYVSAYDEAAEHRHAWRWRIFTLFAVVALISGLVTAWITPVTHAYVSVGDTTYDLGINILGFTVIAEADTDEGTALLDGTEVCGTRFANSLTRLLDASEEEGEELSLQVRVSSSLPFGVAERLSEEASYLIAARGRHADTGVISTEDDTQDTAQQEEASPAQETTNQPTTQSDDAPAPTQESQPTDEGEDVTPEQPQPEQTGENDQTIEETLLEAAAA